MRRPPQVRMLPDDRRLHLQDGPIDLVIQAFGDAKAVLRAYEAAARHLHGLLDALCAELALLRAPADPLRRPEGPVARRMHGAVAPYTEAMFITPMAAVAGAVADEILAAMTNAAEFDRAFVNNGGDIAVCCAPGQRFVAGMVDRPDDPSLVGRVSFGAGDGVGGLATSGWRGRSFSLGIADAVTVLARDAATADAAATVIANAVDLPGHPAVRRAPARAVQVDSDLGDRLVTRGVDVLDEADTDEALEAGLSRAKVLLRRGLILGAALNLQGQTRVAGIGAAAKIAHPPTAERSGRMARQILSLTVSAALLGGVVLGPAWAQTGEVKIGEVNSYSALPSFTEPYRKGWQLAVEDVNAHGGIGGKTLVVISKDDAGKPAEAITAANELVSREGVAMLAGGFFSNVGLALADFAKQKNVFYLAGEPLTDALVWSAGNKDTFRLRPSNAMQAGMLAEEAAKLPAKRWATIAPNYEYGQSAVAVFKRLLSAKRPDIEWVAEQWPPQGKIDAGPVVQAIAAAKPDAILNVEFGPDLVKLVREGNTRGLFKDRSVVSFLTGEPEYLDALKDEAPEGWIVTGYPWYALHTPAHDAFLKAYQDKYHDYPRLGSVVGYSLIEAAADILRKAGSTETDRLIAAAEGLTFDTPFGQATFRAIDHQSTLGAFVGTTTVKDGVGRMTDFDYRDGAKYLPADDEVRKLRPAQ